jgi:hypothetical protein
VRSKEKKKAALAEFPMDLDSEADVVVGGCRENTPFGDG